MGKIRIEIGEYEVYAQGTVISINNKPVKFIIEDLTFELEFIDDDQTSEMKVEPKQFQDKKCLTLIFTNFNNTLGTGNLLPLELGVIDGKALFFNYKIHGRAGEKNEGEVGKTIHYTWLTKKNDGK